MNKAIITATIQLFLSTISLGQEHSQLSNYLQTDKKQYQVGDTIEVSYQFDNLVVLNSNFGGCGYGEYYLVTCHSDSLLSIFHDMVCDELLEEFYYTKQGRFELPIHTPGIYSIGLFLKDKNENAPSDKERFKNRFSTVKFEVIK